MSKGPKAQRSTILIAAVLAAVSLGAGRAAPAADCNGNGQDDLPEVESGAAADCNGNGVPDECDLTIPTLHTGAEILVDEYFVWTKPIADDFDGNGLLDLAGLRANIADMNDIPAVNIWLNRGGGTFELQGTYEHAKPWGQALTSGDFNRDGRTDLAVVSSIQVLGLHDKLSLLLNESQGRFSAPHVDDLPHGYSWAIEAGDFDGDGDSDLVTAGAEGITLSLNGGGGTFDEHRFVDLGLQFSRMASADLDGDGDLDIVAIAYRPLQQAILLRNQGGLQFGDATIYDTQDFLLDVAAADFDRDGALDLALQEGRSAGEGRALLLFGVGGGKLALPVALLSPEGYLRRLITADADADGDVDLFMSADDFVLHRNDGGRVFSKPLILQRKSRVSIFSVQDLYGDGFPEVWYTSAEGYQSQVGVLQIRYGKFSLDCDGDGVLDDCGQDCNGNRRSDRCDIDEGLSRDCNRNGIADECDLDCNDNGVPDDCDLGTGMFDDCNRNGVPDECDGDCNGTGRPDDCDVLGGTSEDCNENLQPDECETDCNENQIPDECDVARGTSLDKDGGGIPDECEHFVFEFVPAASGGGKPGVREIDVLLRTRGLELGSAGAWAWVVVGGTRGCMPVAATVPDSLRPQPAFEQTLAGDELHRYTLRPGAEPVDGVFMSAVVLNFIEPTWLEPAESPHVVVKVTLDAGGEGCAGCEISFPDMTHLIGYPHEYNHVTVSGGEEVRAPTFGTTVSFCGLQLPGDCNQDGGLDISDAICLLGHLFLGAPAAMPCANGTVRDSGNIALLNSNGDALVDLSDAVRVLGYLFGDSGPPVLGAECVPIAGCPDNAERCSP